MVSTNRPRALEWTHIHVAAALYAAHTSLYALGVGFVLAAAFASIAALFALLAISTSHDVSNYGVE